MRTEITSLWGRKKVELRETARVVTPYGGLLVFFEFLRQTGYVEALKRYLLFAVWPHFSQRHRSGQDLHGVFAGGAGGRAAFCALPCVACCSSCGSFWPTRAA